MHHQKPFINNFLKRRNDFLKMLEWLEQHGVSLSEETPCWRKGVGMAMCVSNPCALKACKLVTHVYYRSIA